MIVTSPEQWVDWMKQYTLLPLVIKYPLGADDRLRSWESALQTSGEYAFVLESGKSGRYSYFGQKPISILRGKADEAEMVTETAVGFTEQAMTPSFTRELLHGSPLELVKRWMAPFRSPVVAGAPKFIGGCVGYWGYDVARSIERLPEWSADAMDCPDYYFMMVRKLWIIDHQERQLFCVVHTPLTNEGESLSALYRDAERQANQMKNDWDRFSSEVTDDAEKRFSAYEDLKRSDLQIDVESIDGIRTAFTKQQYIDAVSRVQQYIREGDVFQVNLSVRQSRELQSDPSELYEWLRLLNPSPYMAYIRFPELELVSVSPELLVKLEAGRLSARPIAGTRPRGADQAEDGRLAQELIGNEKERAEHIMLVDLVRNDLGKVCAYGSVKVEDFMVIEAYSHVMHIVSEVQGILAEGKDAFDAIHATFPGGTITGAPKVRTMEIIEELEPVRRGAYTGSIGWIDYNGNMEFNIAIRTLVAIDGSAHIQAGAGIVIDSDPEAEYIESLNKMKALWKAIQYSELTRWEEIRK